MNPIETLNRVVRCLNSDHPRMPGSFTEYLAALHLDELLSVAVSAQVVSERTADDDPEQSVLFRQVAAMAADVIDVREHDLKFPESPLLPRMISAAQGARS